MYFPQHETPPERRLSHAPKSRFLNACVLAALWLFSATAGAFLGCLPPRFKPSWLYRSLLAGVFLGWAAIGLALLVHGSRETLAKANGLVVLFVAAARLCQVFFFDDEADPARTPIARERNRD